MHGQREKSSRKMEARSAPLSKPGSQGSSGRVAQRRSPQHPAFEYFGWVYHLGSILFGVNTVIFAFCISGASMWRFRASPRG